MTVSIRLKFRQNSHVFAQNLDFVLGCYGEYGSGIPAYLNFLKMMALMFIGIALVMLWPGVIYWTNDWTCNPQQMTSEATRCSCFPLFEILTPSAAGPMSFMCGSGQDPYVSSMTNTVENISDITSWVLEELAGEDFISSSWITSGNIGYKREVKSLPYYWFGTMTAWLFVAFIFPHITQQMTNVITDIDRNEILPDDYALKVTG